MDIDLKTRLIEMCESKPSLYLLADILKKYKFTDEELKNLEKQITKENQ